MDIGLDFAKKNRSSFLIEIIELRTHYHTLLTKKKLKRYVIDLLTRYKVFLAQFIQSNSEYKDFSNFFEDYDTSIESMAQTVYHPNKAIFVRNIFALEYSMVSNIHNASIYLLELKQELNSDPYFYGENLTELLENNSVDYLKEDFLKKAPKDIDLIDLMNIKNTQDYNYIIENDFIDLYFMKELSSIYTTNDFNNFLTVENIVSEKILDYDITPIYHYVKIIKKNHYNSILFFFRYLILFSLFLLILLIILTYNYFMKKK